MYYQVNTIRKAIRSVFSDPVTFFVTNGAIAPSY